MSEHYLLKIYNLKGKLYHTAIYEDFDQLRHDVQVLTNDSHAARDVVFTYEELDTRVYALLNTSNYDVITFQQQGLHLVQEEIVDINYKEMPTLQLESIMLTVRDEMQNRDDSNVIVPDIWTATSIRDEAYNVLEISLTYEEARRCIAFANANPLVDNVAWNQEGIQNVIEHLYPNKFKE